MRKWRDILVNFSEYFESIRKKQNLRKVAKSLYIFLTTSDELEKYVRSCLRLQEKKSL